MIKITLASLSITKHTTFFVLISVIQLFAICSWIFSCTRRVFNTVDFVVEVGQKLTSDNTLNKTGFELTIKIETYEPRRGLSFAPDSPAGGVNPNPLEITAKQNKA